MKRLLAVLLASALLFGLLPISVLAEETAAVPAVEDVVILDAAPVETVSTIMPVAPAAAEPALPIAELQETANPTIAVETVEVKSKLEAGSKKDVDVKLLLSDNTGITGAVLKISFAPGMTLKAITRGDALPSLYLTMPGQFVGEDFADPFVATSSVTDPINLLWDGITNELDTTNGVLVTLTFEVPTAAETTYAVSVTSEPGGVFEGSGTGNVLRDVEVDFVNGGVSVVEWVCEHEWDIGTVTTAPTCTATGVKTYTCTVCGASKTETIPALGHDVVNHEAKAATCEEAGWNAYETCSRCDYTTYVEIPATGHTSDGNKNCLENSLCTVCGKVLRVAGEHVWNDGEVTTHATCEADGVKTYTCTECNEIKTETIPAPGHDWGEAVVITAPTCATVGVLIHTCTVCSRTEQETIPALGHDVVNHEAKAATCEEAGWNAYETCSRCDYTTYEEIAALLHLWNEGTVTTPATCTTTGVKTYTCTVCGASKTETIPAFGHAFTYYVSDGNATCKEDGTKTAKCDRCDATDTVTDEGSKQTVAHTFVYTAEGAVITETCSVCEITATATITAENGVYTAEEIKTAAVAYSEGWNGGELEISYTDNVNAGTAKTAITKGEATAEVTFEIAKATTYTITLGNLDQSVADADHAVTAVIAPADETAEIIIEYSKQGEDAWTVEVPAEDGKYDVRATLKADTENIVANAEIVATGLLNIIPHAWNEGTVTTPATCTADGVKTYKCTNEGCTAEKSEIIPALGHDVINHDAKAPACEAIGNEVYETCSRCDYSTYVEIAALGHAYIAHEAKAATCTEIGWNAYETCSRCDYTTYAEIPASGHDMQLTERVDATRKTEGYEIFTCANCGETTTTVLPKLPYILGDINDDGVVNAKDITLLRRSLAGDYGVFADETASDINKDEEVTVKDVTLLRRALAGGFGVTLD